MANGRCKRHGGKSTGPKNPKPGLMIGAENGAYTHGIYTKFFRTEEKALIDEGAIRLGQVDDELRVMRIRLKRTLEAREKWEAECRGEIDGSDEATALVLVETEEGEKPFGAEATPSEFESKKRRLPDFDKIIDTTLARIESLEKTRKELLKSGEDDEPDPNDPNPSRNRVTFTGGLDGGNDDQLPSPFDAPKP